MWTHAALALQGGPTCPLRKLLSVPCGKPSQYAIGLGLLLFPLGTMLSAIIGNTNWPVILSPCVAVWLDPWGKAGIIALSSNMLNWRSLRTSINPSRNM